MDFKLAFKVQEVVKSQFNFAHLVYTDPKLNRHPVIFTTRDELDELSNFQHTIVILNPNDTSLQLKMNIIKGLSDDGAEECVFGIDPGLSIGLSAVFRNEVIDTNLVYSKEKAVDWIKQINKYLECKISRIRIGKGGGSYMHDLLDLLEKSFPNFMIELVDERSTSLRTKKDLSIHEQAAIQIARRVN